MIYDYESTSPPEHPQRVHDRGEGGSGGEAEAGDGSAGEEHQLQGQWVGGASLSNRAL